MGICTALEGVFGRATACAVVVLGGLPLGEDNLSDCRPSRLVMIRSFGVVLALVGLVGEAATFLVDVSSFLLGEDPLDVTVVVEVGGAGCLRE